MECAIRITGHAEASKFGHTQISEWKLNAPAGEYRHIMAVPEKYRTVLGFVKESLLHAEKFPGAHVVVFGGSDITSEPVVDVLRREFPLIRTLEWKVGSAWDQKENEKTTIVVIRTDALVTELSAVHKLQFPFPTIAMVYDKDALRIDTATAVVTVKEEDEVGECND